MRVFFRRFLQDRNGSTAIEYALIGTIVSLATIVGVIAMSDSVEISFVKSEQALTDAWTK